MDERNNKMSYPVQVKMGRRASVTQLPWSDNEADDGSTAQ